MTRTMTIIAAALMLAGCGTMPGTGDATGDANGQDPGPGAPTPDDPSGGDGQNLPDDVCQTAYYNVDFAYGFDLPLTAVLEGQDDNDAALFDAAWTGAESGISYLTATFEWDQPLGGWTGQLNDSIAANDGGEFFAETPIVLSGQRDAILSVYTQSGVRNYRVDTTREGRVISLWAQLLEGNPPDLVSDAQQTVQSLCVD